MVQMLRCLMLVLFFVSLTGCSGRTFREILLPPEEGGPESIAFDSYGGGPYVGVSDGRILRFNQQTSTWNVFAVMPNWDSSCYRSNSLASERHCGRPLGLKFHPITHDLYVADAYYGLVRVSPQGGRGVSVARSAEGIPFKFTNSLDINPMSGMIYFTDSSTQSERWNFRTVIDFGDRTGRLMVYNPVDHRVTVLLNHLCFPNGVALSRNNDFLMIFETTTGQVQRPGSGANVGMPVKIDMQGHILERLDAQSGQLITGASDVKEHNGHVYVGSVAYNSILISN